MLVVRTDWRVCWKMKGDIHAGVDFGDVLECRDDG